MSARMEVHEGFWMPDDLSFPFERSDTRPEFVGSIQELQEVVNYLVAEVLEGQVGVYKESIEVLRAEEDFKERMGKALELLKEEMMNSGSIDYKYSKSKGRAKFSTEESLMQNWGFMENLVNRIMPILNRISDDLESRIVRLKKKVALSERKLSELESALQGEEDEDVIEDLGKKIDRAKKSVSRNADKLAKAESRKPELSAAVEQFLNVDFESFDDLKGAAKELLLYLSDRGVLPEGNQTVKNLLTEREREVLAEIDIDFKLRRIVEEFEYEGFGNPEVLERQVGPVRDIRKENRRKFMRVYLSILLVSSLLMVLGYTLEKKKERDDKVNVANKDSNNNVDEATLVEAEEKMESIEDQFKIIVDETLSIAILKEINFEEGQEMSLIELLLKLGPSSEEYEGLDYLEGINITVVSIKNGYVTFAVEFAELPELNHFVRKNLDPEAVENQ